MISPVEKTRLERLLTTFERNFRLTRMYAEYLERYPELITADMVDALTEDGTLSREEALVALLSEVFALSFDDPEDRVMIRDYLTPSVRVLDAHKYDNNPYYKNVKIENVTDGDWELRRESYAPYRAVICGDISFDGFTEIPPLGFFTERFEFPAVLEGGNEWMTLTPVDLDTCEDAIAAARGKVVTFGLGLGYYAYMAARKSEVSSVTVIEKSPAVIGLFERYILPQLECADKIKIVEADAFEYAEHIMPAEGYDVAFVDTWRDASDGAPMYEKMRSLEHLSENTEFLYWIEGFLKSRLRALHLDSVIRRVESGEICCADAQRELENL